MKLERRTIDELPPSSSSIVAMGAFASIVEIANFTAIRFKGGKM